MTFSAPAALLRWLSWSTSSPQSAACTQPTLTRWTAQCALHDAAGLCMQCKVGGEAGTALTSHLVCELLAGCSQSHRSLAT